MGIDGKDIGKWIQKESFVCFIHWIINAKKIGAKTEDKDFSHKLHVIRIDRVGTGQMCNSKFKNGEIVWDYQERKGHTLFIKEKPMKSGILIFVPFGSVCIPHFTIN